jgi:hypothetical protein
MAGNVSLVCSPLFNQIRSDQIRSDKLCLLAVVNLKRRPMYWVGRE